MEFYSYLCNINKTIAEIMIAEFYIENFFSIKSAQKISFEPSTDTFMFNEYSYEVKDGVRLLKVGIIYGANASGKTNILDAVEFFRMLVLRMPKDRNETTRLSLSCWTTHQEMKRRKCLWCSISISQSIFLV